MRWPVAVLCVALGSACLDERRAAVIQAVCGNGTCETGEDVELCPRDCPLGICGNNTCEVGETWETCPVDCPETLCGNTLCDRSENPVSCPGDCPWNLCGNNLCEPQETATECPRDCLESHCGDGVCDMAETAGNCSEDCPSSDQVDLLVVVDDSPGSGPLQRAVADSYRVLAARLLRGEGLRLSLHLGVVTADLGTWPWEVPGCSDFGDQGILGLAAGRRVAGSCFVSAWRFWIDEPPTGCLVSTYSDGTCADSQCQDKDCPAGLRLSLQPDLNCPRCTPDGLVDQDTVGCLLRVGENGCGFEQPLEAMWAALSNEGENRDFLRSRSLLVVLFVTNEDDCSASEGMDLFNPRDETLGPLTSYRCFQAGVSCRESLEEPGPKTACVPSAEDRYLQPLRRYWDFLAGLRDPGRILVAGIFGGRPENVTVQMDDQGRLGLAPLCLGPSELPVYPAIRLSWFIEHLAGRVRPWSHALVCEGQMGDFMAELAREIRRRLGLAD